MSDHLITLRELAATYIASLRPQVHAVMTRHLEHTVRAFEAALQVRVPREINDVPPDVRALYMLFSGTVRALTRLETPLSGVLEGGLIFRQLDGTGRGEAVQINLETVHGLAAKLEDAQLVLLAQLLQIFAGGAEPSATMDEVRATGLYPGDAPANFDPYEHM